MTSSSLRIASLRAGTPYPVFYTDEEMAIRLGVDALDDHPLAVVEGSISLAGSTPDLYGNHPFRLDFNLSEELDTILRHGLSIGRLPERPGERVSRYLRQFRR
jgi:hypothetical protein